MTRQELFWRVVVLLGLLLGLSVLFNSCYEVPSDIDINVEICAKHDSVTVDSIITLCRIPSD